MAYDPFTRGCPSGRRSHRRASRRRARRAAPAPRALVSRGPGARGQDLADATRDRFTIAPGLPEAAQHAVRGASPAGGRFPLVAYFHGATGHRREASELATYLASHGYVVASPDFTGNTMADMLHDVATRGSEPPRLAAFDQSAADRKNDARLVLDRVLGGVEPAVAALVDAEQIGACGISFGGWTTLALNSLDRRPRASFPIVPAWGKGPVGTEALTALVRLDDWGRPVPTFVLAAERDALVLLPALRELHRDLRPPKRLAILQNAGHLHFADNAEQGHEMLRAMWKSGSFAVEGVEIDFAAIAEASRPFAELCPAAHGADTVQSLCLAHMDAHLKGSADARAFLAGDLARTFTARGITLEVA